MEKGGEILKKDIFKGKIKKEYYSYILGYIIFFLLLFFPLLSNLIFFCPVFTFILFPMLLYI